jgi:hypothetical protein
LPRVDFLADGEKLLFLPSLSIIKEIQMYKCSCFEQNACVGIMVSSSTELLPVLSVAVPRGTADAASFYDFVDIVFP